MWFLKKRGSAPTLDYMQTINNNLKESFARIRRDMQATRDWLSYFKDKEQDHDERLKNVESRLEEISEILNLMQETSNEKEEIRYQIEDNTTEETPSQLPERILNDLTDTQRAIFYRLGMLLYESSQEWITAKSLAQELYPDKAYDRVRSTISEYISILIESGLVKKKRKGKLTYLSITEKGMNLFEKVKRTKLKKIIVKANKEQKI